MSLAPGTNLLHYTLIEQIGAGGMGVVYRATDNKLRRDVAIKILPDEFSEDAERLGRFEREAHVLATLNHPGIASIYGFEEADGVRFLVLELVDGENLDERIARGAFPVHEALSFALQIAEALEEAHGRGVVHRDLKPANVRITPDGTLKVLDFGLARAYLGDKDGAQELSTSPTMTAATTKAGVLLGTAAYMSPEQARGKRVTKRADIWAFGVILFEMLSGRRLFEGETVSDTLAAVLRAEPEWERLPPDTTPGTRRLLRRCLAKNPRQRLHDIADARIELREILDDPEADPIVAAAGLAQRRRPVWMLPSALVGVAGVAAAFGWWAAQRANPSEATTIRKFRLEATHSLITPPDGLGGPVLSPDGKHVVFIHQDQLWVRDLASLERRALPGTRRAERPFWSPGSDWIGFFLGATNNAASLWKTPLREGPTTRLGRLPHASVYGASWTHDGTIVCASTTIDELSESRLFAIDADGGSFVELHDEGSMRAGTLFPHLLPDGQTMLAVEVTNDDRWSVVARKDGRRVELMHHPGERLAHPVFSSTGHVVYQRWRATQVWEETQGIWAFRFDASRLRREGEPFRVSATGFHPSLASDGTLIYHAVEGEDLQQLAWVDRSGTLLEVVGEPHEQINTPEISPDGRKVAYTALDDSNWDIWLLDLDDGSRTRLTVDPAYETDAAWSPDGQRIAFVSGRNGGRDIFVQAATGRGSIEPLVISPEPKFYPEWERDGRGVLFHAFDAESGWQIWRQSIGGEPTRLGFDPEQGQSSHPQLSADGRYLAYRSGAVYLLLLAAPDKRWQVSEETSADGFRWNHSGKEILYVDESDHTLMTTPVETGPDVHIGRKQRLFSGVDLPAALVSYGGRPRYDVYGDRVLVIRMLRQKGVTAVWAENWHLERGG